MSAILQIPYLNLISDTVLNKNNDILPQPFKTYVLFFENWTFQIYIFERICLG